MYRSKNRVIVIFPNKEVEVGTMKPGDHLVVREVGGPNGRDWKAFIEVAERVNGPIVVCVASIEICDDRAGI